MFGRSKGGEAVVESAPASGEVVETAPPRPGTLVEGRHGRALVIDGDGWAHLELVTVVREVTVGQNRDGTARSGVRVETRSSAIYAVVDDRLFTISRTSMPVGVPLWSVEKGGPAMPGRPWWAHLVPRVLSTVEMLDAADESTPAPWAAAMAADAALVGLRAEYDRLVSEALDGNYAPGNEVRVRNEAVELLGTIRRREQYVRGVWIEEHATGPKPEEVELRQGLHLVHWWASRDGSAGSVALFEAEAARIYLQCTGRQWKAPNVAGSGQHEDPAVGLRNDEAWFAQHGLEVPAVPFPDLPARPSTLAEAVAAALRGQQIGATDA